MNTEQNGILFSDEYQKSLKEQFCYPDADPVHGERLFLKTPAALSASEKLLK